MPIYYWIFMESCVLTAEKEKITLLPFLDSYVPFGFIVHLDILLETYLYR